MTQDVSRYAVPVLAIRDVSLLDCTGREPSGRMDVVAIGSGSDVVGPWQGRRAEEIVLKSKYMGPHRAILSATRANAELFGLGHRIGTAEDGKQADLILASGSPLEDAATLVERASVPMVVKVGVVEKDVEKRMRLGRGL